MHQRRQPHRRCGAGLAGLAQVPLQFRSPRALQAGAVAAERDEARHLPAAGQQGQQSGPRGGEVGTEHEREQQAAVSDIGPGTTEPALPLGLVRGRHKRPLGLARFRQRHRGSVRRGSNLVRPNRSRDGDRGEDLQQVITGQHVALLARGVRMRPQGRTIRE